MGYRLSFLDKSFWLTESTANPKHVGCLQLLALPENVDVDDYVQTLLTELKSFSKATPPFNCKIKSFLGYPVGLQPAKRMEMDYHIRLHVVDDVTDKMALDDFVARLHESRLDPEKPLWQYHFIHDGKHDRYAIYARVHHLYGDGATLVRWFQAGYLSKPDTATFKPVWAVKRLRKKGRKAGGIKGVWQSVAGAIRATFDLLVIFSRLFLKLIHINPHYMPIPFTGTKTVLTGQVKPGRAVATTDLDFERVRRVAK